MVSQHSLATDCNQLDKMEKECLDSFVMNPYNIVVRSADFICNHSDVSRGLKSGNVICCMFFETLQTKLVRLAA